MKKIYSIDKNENILDYVKKNKILKKNIIKNCNSNKELIDILKKKKIFFFIKKKKKRKIITIIGHSNNGKTTLIKELSLHNKINEYNNITQISNAYLSKEKYGDFIIIDTPGHDDFFYIKKKAINLSNLVFLILESGKEIEPNTLEVLEYIKKKNKDFFFLINKIDLKNNLDITINSVKKFINLNNLKSVFFKISAKKKIGIKEVTNFIKIKKYERIKYSYIVESNFIKGKIITKILLNSNFIYLGGKIFDKYNNIICTIKKIYLNSHEKKIAFSCELVEVIGFNKKYSFGKKIFFKVNKKNLLLSDIKKNKEDFTFLKPKKKSFFLISDNSNFLETILRIFNSSVFKKKYNIIGKKIINNCFEEEIIKECTYLYYGKRKFKKNSVCDFYSLYDIYSFLNKKKNINYKYKNLILIKKIFNKKNCKIFGVVVKRGCLNLNSNYSLIRRGVVINSNIKISSIRFLNTYKNSVKSVSECGVIFKNYNKIFIKDILFKD
ncbi:GTP-binding protein [Candidatus Vidania fulgoroideorum]